MEKIHGAIHVASGSILHQHAIVRITGATTVHFQAASNALPLYPKLSCL
jgi:hypothetical protein